MITTPPAERRLLRSLMSGSAGEPRRGILIFLWLGQESDIIWSKGGNEGAPGSEVTALWADLLPLTHVTPIRLKDQPRDAEEQVEGRVEEGVEEGGEGQVEEQRKE